MALWKARGGSLSKELDFLIMALWKARAGKVSIKSYILVKAQVRRQWRRK